VGGACTQNLHWQQIEDASCYRAYERWAVPWEAGKVCIVWSTLATLSWQVHDTTQVVETRLNKLDNTMVWVNPQETNVMFEARPQTSTNLHSATLRTKETANIHERMRFRCRGKEFLW